MLLFGWLRIHVAAWPTVVVTATLWTLMHAGLLVGCLTCSLSVWDWDGCANGAAR
jgi:hypothetical protein